MHDRNGMVYAMLRGGACTGPIPILIQSRQFATPGAGTPDATMIVLLMRLARHLLLALCAAALLQASLSSEERFLADAITANELKAYVSFLASDPLEGRDTPSKGLDVAAEYIASEFRRAGLEPAGDDGYFQTAPYATVTENLAEFRFSIETDGKTISVPLKTVRATAESTFDAKDVRLVKVSMAEEDSALEPEKLEGKAVLAERPDFGSMAEDKRQEAYRKMLRIRAKLLESKAVLLIESTGNLGPSGPRLTDLSGRKQAPPPSIVIRDTAFREFAKSIPLGETVAKVSAHIEASDIQRVKLKNVAGLLRGSDAALKETYVIVSGHYDHLGRQGDSIYSGANDDASGTAAMLSLAEAVARMPQPPKRSIVFVAYFGEEKGLLGSRYYGAHPLFPLASTIANLNLEQLGRTDDSEGKNLKRVFVTGFDYSNLHEWLTAAGHETGVTFYKHGTNSDSFFGRSDNQSLADAGVPAHTLGTAFLYPDYHQPGDHWDKIDYDNMAVVTRTIGVALVRLANSPKPVVWSTDNAKAANYVKAATGLRTSK